jgi:hypothetical protein
MPEILDPKATLAGIKAVLSRGAASTGQALGGLGPSAMVDSTFSHTPLITNTAKLVGAGTTGALKIGGRAAGGALGLAGRALTGSKKGPASETTLTKIKDTLTKGEKLDEKDKSETLLKKIFNKIDMIEQSVRDGEKMRIAQDKRARKNKKRDASRDEEERRERKKGLLGRLLPKDGAKGKEGKEGKGGGLMAALASGGLIGLGGALAGMIGGSLISIIGTLVSGAGSLMLKGLTGSSRLLGKMATTVGGRLLGGILGLAIDGLLGYFKSDEWSVTKGAGAIGGMIGGTFENQTLNMFMNAGKWAMIGATIGSIVPVIGTAIGGMVGALIGAVLGYFGGEKIAKAVDGLAKSAQNMADEVIISWTKFNDKLILVIREKLGWFGKMFGLQTSEEEAAIKAHLKEEQAARGAHKDWQKDRPMVGDRFASDEEAASIKTSGNILSSPEMVQFAIEDPDKYIDLANHANAGNPLLEYKDFAQLPENIRKLIAAGVQAPTSAPQPPPATAKPPSGLPSNKEIPPSEEASFKRKWWYGTEEEIMARNNRYEPGSSAYDRRGQRNIEHAERQRRAASQSDQLKAAGRNEGKFVNVKGKSTLVPEAGDENYSEEAMDRVAGYLGVAAKALMRSAEAQEKAAGASVKETPAIPTPIPSVRPDSAGF